MATSHSPMPTRHPRQRCRGGFLHAEIVGCKHCRSIFDNSSPLANVKLSLNVCAEVLPKPSCTEMVMT